MELLIHFCNETRPDRLNEFLFCLRKNLENRYISRVHNFCMKGVNLPNDIINSDKHHLLETDHRIKFSEFFDYANKNLPGKLVAIANLDIFFDNEHSDWTVAETTIKENPQIVMCQSRIEYINETNKFLDPGFMRLAYANAQDAWIFKAPFILQGVDFEIGTIGADNAIADRIKKANRFPINFGSRFKIFHYDICRGKSAHNTLKIHHEDSIKTNTIFSRSPEKEGCYLLPDFDVIKSIDQLADALKVPPLRRYQVICDLMSEFVKIDNSIN